MRRAENRLTGTKLEPYGGFWLFFYHRRRATWMNMATLIFACEYGTGLGTASAFMPVANALREADWTVEFALPHAAPGIELVKRTLAMNKYNYFDAPGACVGAA